MWVLKDREQPKLPHTAEGVNGSGLTTLGTIGIVIPSDSELLPLYQYPKETGGCTPGSLCKALHSCPTCKALQEKQHKCPSEEDGYILCSRFTP